MLSPFLIRQFVKSGALWAPIFSSFPGLPWLPQILGVGSAFIEDFWRPILKEPRPGRSTWQCDEDIPEKTHMCWKNMYKYMQHTQMHIDYWCIHACAYICFHLCTCRHVHLIVDAFMHLIIQSWVYAISRSFIHPVSFFYLAIDWFARSIHLQYLATHLSTCSNYYPILIASHSLYLLSNFPVYRCVLELRQNCQKKQGLSFRAF